MSSAPGDQPSSASTDSSVHRDRWGDFWMRLMWRKPPVDLAERTRRRVSVHLIPMLFCLYIVAYLDRANLGWAKLDMNKDPSLGGLGFNEEIIGLAGGMFFWGYWLLEIPSTLSVLKRGARWVFVRILILWGICATLTGFIGYPPVMEPMFGWIPHFETELPIVRSIAQFTNNLSSSAEYQLYFFRFMLGFFEGGFFPTVIFFLSIWYRQKDRAKAIALFMSAIPLSLAFGSVLSQQLFKLDWFDLQGWRWIFIIQGMLPVGAAIGTALMLPNNMNEAKWLKDEERTWLREELAAEGSQKHMKHGFAGFKSHIGVVLLLTLVYFGQNVSSYGLSTFMPSFYQEFVKTDAQLELEGEYKILKAVAAPDAVQSDRLKVLEADIKQKSTTGKNWVFLLTTLTYFIAFSGMLFNGWHSDKHQERIWHVCIPLITLGFFMFMAGIFFKTPSIALVVMLFGVGFFHYAHLPAFWPIPTMFLGSAAAASAIGFINMMGNLGGAVGQTVVGYAGNESFQRGMFYIAPAPIIAGLIVLGISKLKHKE